MTWTTYYMVLQWDIKRCTNYSTGTILPKIYYFGDAFFQVWSWNFLSFFTSHTTHFIPYVFKFNHWVQCRIYSRTRPWKMIPSKWMEVLYTARLSIKWKPCLRYCELWIIQCGNLVLLLCDHHMNGRDSLNISNGRKRPYLFQETVLESYRKHNGI